MIYLIGQLSLWLFLAMLFAALAGWAFAAHQSAPAERSVRREREHLLKDIIALAWGEGGARDDSERERADEAVRSLSDIRDARIAHLEQALEGAREHADDAASQIAELERRLERSDDDARELARLRSLENARESQGLVDAHVEEIASPDDAAEDAALQGWRLRYFEQRVRYLESLARPEVEQVAVGTTSTPTDALGLLAADWRAREAEARAAFLENELRTNAATATDAEAEPPFAANADVDMLLRWRLLYLERRVAHLQSRGAVAPMPVMSETAFDPDRWKWRARYLEARVRHLEQRPVEQAPLQAAPLEPAEEEASLPPPPRAKPPVLPAARHGGPDDFTLIEGVSLMQQSTLYSLGIFHFEQIAAWTPENVAWVDNYLRLRGRIDEEEWVEQADELARFGPTAARRAVEEA